MSILVIIYKDIIVISNFKSKRYFKRENVCVNRTTHINYNIQLGFFFFHFTQTFIFSEEKKISTTFSRNNK